MKTKKVFKCSSCGYISPGFFGKCPECSEWGTIEEIEEVKEGSLKKTINKSSKSKKLINIKTENSFRVKTDIEEFNRVMGGGIVRDSVSILTAKPGAGKSTLLKVLTGVHESESGSIHMAGNSNAIVNHSPQEAQANGISTVYQEVNLCPNLTVEIGRAHV